VPAMLVGAILRALALIAITAASVAMFVRSLRGEAFEAFVRHNSQPFPDRIKLIVTMVVAAVVATAGAGIYGRLRGVDKLTRLSHRLAPLAALGLVPALCTPAAWADPLTAVLAIGAFVLLEERLLRLAF
jgi:hypothetical protein